MNDLSPTIHFILILIILLWISLPLLFPPSSPYKFYSYIHDFVVIVCFDLGSFETHWAYWRSLWSLHYWDYSLGPGRLLSGYTDEKDGTSPTESISSKGHSSGRGKAPELFRPWLTVQAHPSVSLLQAGQQLWGHGCTGYTVPRTQHFTVLSQGYILPDLTVILLSSKMFPKPYQEWLYIFSLGPNIQLSLRSTLSSYVSLQSPPLQRRSLIKAVNGICL